MDMQISRMVLPWLTSCRHDFFSLLNTLQVKLVWSTNWFKDSRHKLRSSLGAFVANEFLLGGAAQIRIAKFKNCFNLGPGTKSDLSQAYRENHLVRRLCNSPGCISRITFSEANSTKSTCNRCMSAVSCRIRLTTLAAPSSRAASKLIHLLAVRRISCGAEKASCRKNVGKHVKHKHN